MEKEKRVEDNFADMLAMLKKKVQEKDEEISRLRKENQKLKEVIPEEELNALLLDETFKRRQGNTSWAVTGQDKVQDGVQVKTRDER